VRRERKHYCHSRWTDAADKRQLSAASVGVYALLRGYARARGASLGIRITAEWAALVALPVPCGTS